MFGCLIGGMKMGPQVRALQARPAVVVATPGRLLDHVERGTIRLNPINELVLDEADHMLDMGFMPQVLRILKLLQRRRTMMFSATMPEPIERLAQQFMVDPVRIDILPEGRSPLSRSLSSGRSRSGGRVDAARRSRVVSKLF